MKTLLATHKTGRHQRGVVLIFTVFWLITVIALLAVVIDLGRIFLLARNLQNSADASALAGAQALVKLDPLDYTSVPKSDVVSGGWTQVKPRVRFVLYNSKFQGVQQIGTSFTFNQAIPSHSWDSAGFQGTEGVSGTGTGTVRVQVLRGLVCYNSGDPTQQWIPLESTDQYYCIANAVEARLTVTDVPFYFAPFFGIASKSSMSRVARSHVRKAPPLSCGDPPCTNFFGPDGYTTGEAIDPSIICP